MYVPGQAWGPGHQYDLTCAAGTPLPTGVTRIPALNLPCWTKLHTGPTGTMIWRCHAAATACIGTNLTLSLSRPPYWGTPPAATRGQHCPVKKRPTAVHRFCICHLYCLYRWTLSGRIKKGPAFTEGMGEGLWDGVLRLISTSVLLPQFIQMFKHKLATLVRQGCATDAVHCCTHAALSRSRPC